MHILFLIDRLSVAGGTELHLLDLTSGLSSQGIQVSVVSFYDSEFSQCFRELPNVNYHCLNAPCIYDLKGIQSVLWLYKYMRREKVDIVQSFHAASDLVSPVLGLLSLGATSVISSRRDLGYTKSKRVVALQKFLNRFVKVILANSEQVKQSIIATECVASEKVFTIYNGIYPDKVSVSENFSRRKYRANKNIPADCLLIGSLGHFQPVKGFEDFIQAARIISDKYRGFDIKFVLAGENENLQCLIDELNLEGYFFLLGPVRDVGAYLNSLDIYVQPSHSEGFSNAILEAMLARLPVIISSVGGNIEIVKHGEDGFLFEAKNVGDLVEKIELVMNDTSSVKEVATAAYHKIKSNFIIDRMISEYISLYEEICR